MEYNLSCRNEILIFGRFSSFWKKEEKLKFDRDQKRFLNDLINNPVLGLILIEFNFSQQNNAF